MEKKVAGPSGDKHDYVSISAYWWPDPRKPNGLPWVNHDGVRNESLKHDFPDQDALEQMLRNVQTLGLANFVLEEKKYGDRAVEHIHAWFIDPATRMNPNFRFAQGRPGIDNGTPQGMIEIHWLPGFLEAVKLLQASSSLSESDSSTVRSWMNKFRDWMRTSELGRKASELRNNHGNYYDEEVVALDMYEGQDSAARDILNGPVKQHIDGQIMEDGRQPLEIARTKGLGYSVFNLESLCDLATYGSHLGVDLWGYRNVHGAGIKQAVDLIAPFATGKRPWFAKQIEPYKPQNFYCALHRAAKAYGEAEYQPYLDAIPQQFRAADRCNIIY
jgi:hypothetical protein